MKICFLIGSLATGGAERTVAYLSSYASNHGYDVDIVHYGTRGFYKIDEKVNIIRIGKEQIKFDLFSRAYNILLRIKDFRRYVKNNKPDVFFCMLFPAIPYTFFVNRKIKKITSERSNPGDMTNKSKIFVRKIFLKYADGIVFQTQRAKDFYKDMIQDKGTVIPNAVGNNYVYQVPEVTTRQNKIVAMGSLKKVKDYPTLLKALKIVLEKHPEYVLEIFGQGRLHDQLAEMAKELHINEKVFFMGAHCDAIIKIADAKIYVMSSISEGMPNALMEAMAIGLACVSTDCDNGPAELIQDGENGLLVPVKDHIALANAINRFIEDEALAIRCGENAKKIKETNSIELICERYLNYINEIANQ